jgi:16S rRNA (cytosine1402-N4)-methyltransferase
MTYHTPVLLNESINGLNIRPNGVYVDVTFGGGGHSREILTRLSGGKLVAFDQDEEAFFNIPDDKRFIFVKHNFRFLKNFLKYHKVEKVDGILADLGVSSHQFDAGYRGFSFRSDAELDMRMNKNSGLTAKTVVNESDQHKLCCIFRDYGEVSNAMRLAKTIIDARNQRPLETTSDLVNAISDLVPPQVSNKFLAQVFQALRIEVNGEMEALKELLLQTPDVLLPGGRLVVITYHSLEDRLVKNFMKKGKFEGEVEKDIYGNFEVPFKLVNNRVIIPDSTEIEENNRARSAKLRIAERI